LEKNKKKIGKDEDGSIEWPANIFALCFDKKN